MVGVCSTPTRNCLQELGEYYTYPPKYEQYACLLYATYHALRPLLNVLLTVVLIRGVLATTATSTVVTIIAARASFASVNSA